MVKKACWLFLFLGAPWAVFGLVDSHMLRTSFLSDSKVCKAHAPVTSSSLTDLLDADKPAIVSLDPSRSVIVSDVPNPSFAAVSNKKPHSRSYLTWRRRLDTRQDPFDIHKWSGFAWWVSATAIFGTGTLSGFTEAPAVLENYTYLFLIATFTQALSSVPMAIKYRSNEPAVQRGFISSAIASSSSAFVGFWLSPFVDDTILGPSVVAALVGTFVVADTLYSMTSFNDIRSMWNDFQEKERQRAQEGLKLVTTTTKKLSAEFLSTIPWALPLNFILLHEMIYHANDMRNYFVHTIVAHGSSLELVYYASLVTSIAVSVGNLAATLRHRKLISKEVNDIALIGSWVVTMMFNLKGCACGVCKAAVDTTS